MTTATDLRMLMNSSVSVGSSISAQRIQNPALPRLKPDLDLSDSSLVAVYCFVKNYIGASGTSAVAIDNKIEQAMDLVKSHLMFAVREEVEVLKEKIAELMERISQLEVENNLLRAHAPPEVVAQLPQPTGPGAPPPQQPQYPPNGNIS